MRQLFCFFQFNGNNASYCNQKCPYCYEPKKRMVHEWNPTLPWEQGFERLKRDIYFNLCYGEPMVGNGFYEVLDMIGRHENWEATVITNLSQDPTRMIQSQLGQDKRIYIHAAWHPLGGGKWEQFTTHLLQLQEADIPTIVVYLFWPPQIDLWKQYWKWLDEHNVRTCIRRFVGRHMGQDYPLCYHPTEKEFFKAMYSPKTMCYGFDLKEPKGNLCSAGKDMILVKSNGKVAFCADREKDEFGDLFDPNFQLMTRDIVCNWRICGGDYGLLHMQDLEFGPIPDMLWHDCFVAQVENITGGGKERVNYPRRGEMEKWLLNPS